MRWSTWTRGSPASTSTTGTPRRAGTAGTRRSSGRRAASGRRSRRCARGSAPCAADAVRLAVISDTHLPRGQRRLPDRCVEELAKADLILHAGDVATVAVLDEIAAIGPEVHAVFGNVDEPALR